MEYNFKLKIHLLFQYIYKPRDEDLSKRHAKLQNANNFLVIAYPSNCCENLQQSQNMSSSFLKKLQQQQEESQDKPTQAPIKEDEEMEEDEESKDQIKEISQSLQSVRLKDVPAKVPLPAHMYTKPIDVATPHHFGAPLGAGKVGPNYDPLPWSDFFDRKELILDGRIPIYIAGNQGHVFLCLHGAGHSALSFAALAKQMKASSTIVTFDFRGHGEHYCENETDLSVETLVSEAIQVFAAIAGMYPEASIILVGHSMGGSIATKTSQKILNDHRGDEWHKQLQGLFVIDVVEGSAMDALPFMENIVMSRPQHFKSLQSVVQYGIKSGTVKDLESARVSMPPQVVRKIDAPTGLEKFVWRTDLLATKPYWEGWFKGLTQDFLNTRVPKQLLLAGSDRMDKELTIAQMQGKFKLVVLDQVGHVIHEDQPKKVAQVFQDFVVHFKIPAKYNQQMVVTSVSGKQVVISH